MIVQAAFVDSFHSVMFWASYGNFVPDIVISMYINNDTCVVQLWLVTEQFVPCHGHQTFYKITFTSCKLN